MDDPRIIAAIIGALAGLGGAIIVHIFQHRRLKSEFGTEMSVEKALHQFLSLNRVPYRSFPMIRHHIGGFESNELRRLLVRAGAVRFMANDGTELWALRDRVTRAFIAGMSTHPEEPENKISESELFPGAFDKVNEY